MNWLKEILGVNEIRLNQIEDEIIFEKIMIRLDEIEKKIALIESSINTKPLEKLCENSSKPKVKAKVKTTTKKQTRQE